MVVEVQLKIYVITEEFGGNGGLYWFSIDQETDIIFLCLIMLGVGFTFLNI